MNRRAWIFLAIFALMNLSFIPLLSLYGLRVCPVLSIPGFGFGCYYSAAYILFVNLFNFVFIVILRPGSGSRISNWLAGRRNLIYAAVYMAASAIALLVLQIMLKMNHLTTHSRGPEILGLASLLLGILQAYGLNWANPAARRPGGTARFKQLWLLHVSRTMFPVAITSGVLLHFLISQSVSFNEGKTAPLIPNDEIILQTSLVIAFLLGWLFVTFLFHFLSERDHMEAVQSHIGRLQALDFAYRTREDATWGLWRAIVAQLNSISQALGERAQLVKSFSRFVTASVAEQALRGEIREAKGRQLELTVMMTDIRNFTALSERLSADQVVELLNEYFSAMLDELAKFNVVVDKFIGDGVLAYVDAPAGGNASADNTQAVEAALAMLRRLATLNRDLAAKNLPEISIGIGIFRGPLVIGLIGSEAKLQHTIIGDTVNRTARLEGLCKELGTSIVISSHVWYSLPANSQRQFRSFGKVAVKGLSVPMEVFGGPIA